MVFLMKPCRCPHHRNWSGAEFLRDYRRDLFSNPSCSDFEAEEGPVCADTEHFWIRRSRLSVACAPPPRCPAAEAARTPRDPVGPMGTS